MGKGCDGLSENIQGAPTGNDSLFLISTYTDTALLAHTPKGQHGEGVYAVSLCSRTGTLTPLKSTSLGPNVAFLVQHPTFNKIYATTECINADGEVLELEFDSATNELEVVGRQPAGGKSTCYLNLQTSDEHIIAVNYWDAKVSVLPLDKSSGSVSGPIDVLMQPGAAYVEEKQPTRDEHWQFRQRWPHSHCCVTEPYQGKYAFVTDLGLDKVFAYELEGSKLVEKAEIALQAGRGPRHLIFHPTIPVAYIVNELESSISTFKYNHKDIAQDEKVTDNAADSSAILSHIQTITTLTPDMQGQGFITPDGAWKAHSHCSEIRLHPSGKFVYVGNRGHDSIAVFKVDTDGDGRLSEVEIVPSGGRCPRNFNFNSDGRYMVVGNQDSNNITSFTINTDAGNLTQLHTVDLPSPNYVYNVPRVS